MLYPEINKVISMENLQNNIEIAIEKGLFDTDASEDKKQIFDLYGNYSFPTDFSNSKNNTILSVSQSNNTIIGRNS